MRKTNTDVVVIGGGASGMLASALVAEQGIGTVVLERNGFTGKKLRITDLFTRLPILTVRIRFSVSVTVM